MAKKKDSLPVYRLVVNELKQESGFDYVSFVDYPAIEEDFFAFSSKRFQYKADKDRRIVTGPILVADKPIYRFDEKTKEEFWVVFEKPTIEKMVQKFMKSQMGKNVNVMHDTKVDGVYLFEIQIADKTRGTKAPKGFEKLADGSAFASYKVDNDDVWQSVLDGTFKGFSIEGYFDMLEVKMRRDEIDIAFDDL